MASTGAPFIVGLGGTTREGSSSEQAVRYALLHAEELGARTRMFSGRELLLPMYSPERPERSNAAIALIEALRNADGIIVGSPAYHGSLSGLIKNALDYIEDMRDDDRIYLDGRTVGCVTCSYGAQAAGTTLMALRSIAHALRGWPTPLGVAINSSLCTFTSDGPQDPTIAEQLRCMARQVVRLAPSIVLPQSLQAAE
ncbi:MAG TPA: NADPH-dependent oxidoreductase [Aurantimonas coralicida]|uniref:NADPH-dependent oxidoreductase n=2 Tax=root TaxID=1 RepID=A0A9C9NGC2_9HYPH|nr:NADPH-dependent oxidoreductase [Aurantimonas coralicida]HEU01595.1 NADPH-dependent oxidoreductase [Aurantimonas coralicida]